MKPEKIGTYYDSIAQARMDALLAVYMKYSSNDNLEALIKTYRSYLIHDFRIKKLPATVLAAAAIENIL